MGYIQELRSKIGHDPVILVGAVALIHDETGAVLLQKRTYPRGSWGIPGGLMELGESAEETVVREFQEEAGILIGNLQLFQVYSGAQVPSIAKNGDLYYPVTIAYEAELLSAEWQIDPEESAGFEFRTKEKVPKRLLRNHGKILMDYFERLK
ncbi:NUDIX domain-containing protein [Sporolactobacillus sp. CPB3-1]|uniref:NUDIX domain-containing protein n=1 Tax=Sporolactobacillus mangiferae TaxID=2940498 RepID=A0ABT0MAI6_9BACL|nr:NUDIX domain-containing protein [Sporolactobacillus mangiferae]MCL1631886.1 NUDIX domain-containing protein [Sporolactobacillus mangiferae]